MVFDEILEANYVQVLAVLVMLELSRNHYLNVFAGHVCSAPQGWSTGNVSPAVST